MKIKIKGKLPKGFKLANGGIVRSMEAGGTVNNTLQPIPRDQANLEAEKGETTLTDLTNDGSFELYNIGGKRHTDGGTPLNLPEQSFVYSDTRSMKLTIEELESIGITSKKKITPAEASKKFPLNKYIEILEDETSDKISIETAEEMINKNKIKLSQIAFIQESKKDFSDGLPLAAYPFLISKGINPQELEAKIAEQNGPQQTPPPQMSQDQMAMGPQQGNLQQFTGPPQGGMPPMGKYGTELPQAMFGMAGLKYMNPFMKNKDEKLKEDVGDMMSMGKMFAGGMEYGGATHTMPDGTVHPGATHEEYLQMMKASMGYETSPMTGQPMVPQMGVPEGYVRDENPLGLPGYQSKGEVLKPTTLIDRGKKVLNYFNPKTFNFADNWLISSGGKSNPIMTNKFNIGDKNLGLINTELTPNGRGLIENVKVWGDNQGYGLGTSLYSKALQTGQNENLFPGLISGDQTYNPMESPEKTINMWKYFDKETVQINENTPLFSTSQDKLWQTADDTDFTQYLKEVDGTMVYEGPRVRFTGLNELGMKKLQESELFFKELQVAQANQGNEGSSGLANWTTEYTDGVGPDWHSPIGRSILNKFKTSFGREPRIGNGERGDKSFKDYNKASLYTLLALGTFAYFNKDKINSTEEEILYEEWKKKRAGELGMSPEEYDIWIETPENTMPIEGKSDVDLYLEDSLDKGLDIKKFGGQPFKMSALRKFTNGGDPTHPENHMYGAAPSGAVQGGTLPEVEVFANMGSPTGLSPEQTMMMAMAEERRLLLERYSGLKKTTEVNPNLLEDPETARDLQANIVAIENQIAAIDQKTSMIEQQLLQQSLQLDPFSPTGTPTQQAKYGGQLPKFNEGGDTSNPQDGETYAEWAARIGITPDPNINPDDVFRADEGVFFGEREFEVEYGPADESSFTFRNDDGSPASPNPYYTDQGMLDANSPYYEGATGHDKFYTIMNSNEFAGVREEWLKIAKKEILNAPTPTTGQAAIDNLKALQDEIKAGGPDLDQKLFKRFNDMNRLLSLAADNHQFEDGDQSLLEDYAKQMGLPVPDMASIMSFQGMYRGLANVKNSGTANEKKLLSQINLSAGDKTGGSSNIGGSEISNIDGWIGDTTGEQFMSVNPTTEVRTEVNRNTVKCSGEYKQKKMDECRNKPGFKFDPQECDCLPIPPDISTVKKPRYETFVQDDMAVAVKSGQFPTLLNPTLQGTPDPAMVDPMYVDPRQALSSLEATAASAIRAGANATQVMGSLQNESEKVINQHEALNTKIFNNAQNINVPALNQFTQSKMDSFKNYMDESAMALGNYQTEYKDAEDALLSAEQSQISNADEMYIRNLENPNYWFSPQRHNIEFYNPKDVEGTQGGQVLTYEQAAQQCKDIGFNADKSAESLRKCINDRMGYASNNNKSTNVNRNSTNNNEENVSLGKEVKGFSKRQADLVSSRNKLRKWLTGH